MQRIFNFLDWRTLSDGQKVGFPGKTSRVVVLEVNAQDEARLFVEEDGTIHFLAVVFGRDEIQFAVEGGFAIICEGGPVHFKTAEDSDWSVQPVDDTTFTTLVERRQRNPELEQIMYQAQINMERRLAAQSEEFQRRIDAAVAAGNMGIPGRTAPAASAIVSGGGAADGGETGGAGGKADGSVAPAPSSAPAADAEGGGDDGSKAV